jgi:glucan phosphoethanolaminetransferase (alkaline phosphatase superfamily)
MLSQWPPLKLAKLGFASLVLSESCLLSWALVLVPIKLRSVLLGLHPSHFEVIAYTTVSLIVVFSPSLIGLLLFHLSKRQFDIGLDNEQWTKQETDQVLLWVESPGLKRMWILLVSSMVICSIAVFSIAAHLRWPDDSAGRITLYLIIFLCYVNILLPNPREALAQIRKQLRPKSSQYDPSKSWVNTYKQLHSDHWGGRETPRTERPEA